MIMRTLTILVLLFTIVSKIYNACIIKAHAREMQTKASSISAQIIFVYDILYIIFSAVSIYWLINLHIFIPDKYMYMVAIILIILFFINNLVAYVVGIKERVEDYGSEDMMIYIMVYSIVFIPLFIVLSKCLGWLWNMLSCF